VRIRQGSNPSALIWRHGNIVLNNTSTVEGNPDHSRQIRLAIRLGKQQHAGVEASVVNDGIRCIATGMTTLDFVLDAPEFFNVICLQKPFRPAELARAIKTATAPQPPGDGDVKVAGSSAS